jgi:hypothetical protein
MDAAEALSSGADAFLGSAPFFSHCYFRRNTLNQIRLALIAVALSVPMAAHAQAPSADTNLCCGTVTHEGQILDRVIDSMHVDQLWQPHVHIDWQTGQQDKPATYTGPDKATHCSSFTAALGEKLHVYLLHPPEHPQQLLASAQARWFHSKEGVKDGWVPVETAVEAQTRANKGELVMVVFESPDESKPGHIAVVRPTAKTTAEIEKDGPQTAQAGALNFSSGVARVSFAKHPGAWPNGVKYYAHTVGWPPAKESDSAQ